MKRVLFALVISTSFACTTSGAGTRAGIVHPGGAQVTLTREAVQSRVLSELHFVNLNSIKTELYTAGQFESKFQMGSSFNDPAGNRLYPQLNSPIWVTTIEGEGLVFEGNPGFGGKLFIAMWGENYSHPLLNSLIVAGAPFTISNFF